MNRDINKNRWEKTDCYLSITVSWKQFLKVYIRFEFGRMVGHVCVRGRKMKLEENKTCQIERVSAELRFHFSFSEIPGDVHCLDALFIFVSVDGKCRHQENGVKHCMSHCSGRRKVLSHFQDFWCS